MSGTSNMQLIVHSRHNVLYITNYNPLNEWVRIGTEEGYEIRGCSHIKSQPTFSNTDRKK